MKQNIFLQKAASFFAMFLLAVIALFSTVSAQVLVPPVMPDVFVGPAPGYPNSSTIDYSNFFMNPTPQFTAMVTDGGPGGAPPMLYTNDLAGGPGWVATFLPIPAGSSPDVIVGNDMAIPGDLLIAVIATVPTCPTGNDAVLYLYRQAGPAPYVGAPLAIGAFNLSGTCNVAGPAHIDIIDEYSTPIGFPPLPRANVFVATWKDNVQGIMGYSANLNAPFAGVPVVMNANVNLSSPDVAGVERQNTAGLFEYWGLFSYLDQTVWPNQLWYQDWNITFPAIGIPVLYDVQNYITWAGYTSGCRIDGIDDYTQNNPAGGNAYFDIVTSVVLAGPPGGAAIYQYNNLNGVFPPLAVTDITSPVAGVGGNKNVMPQVTAGQGGYYSIAYYSYGPWGQMYLANAIDWPTGTTTTTNNAYQVNLGPLGWGPGLGICVSGTHNTNVCAVQQLFTGFANGGVQWEKYNASICPPFAFKHDPGVVAAANTDWLLTPNPASDHVTLTAPAGFKADEGTAWRITDLSGKTLLQGAVSKTELQIGVSNLSAGMYMLNVQDKGTNPKTIKFVKD